MLLLFLNICLLHHWVMPILFFQVFTFLFACVNMFPQRLLGRNWLRGVCHRSSDSPAGTWAHQGHTGCVCRRKWSPRFCSDLESTRFRNQPILHLQLPSSVLNCIRHISAALFAIYKTKEGSLFACNSLHHLMK